MLIADDSAGGSTKVDSHLREAFAGATIGATPFFVVFGGRAQLGAAKGMRDWNERGTFVVARLQTVASNSQAGVAALLTARKIDFTSFWIENRIYVPQGNRALANELAMRPEVAAILPEETVPVHFVSRATANERTASSSPVGVPAWNITRVGADQVWSTYSNTGSGIVVANIDTGVRYDHPALISKYRGNNGDGTYSHAPNWFDATNLCGAAPCDTVGHGTHTMGTMVGDDGAGHIIGVAPGAKWIACKACSRTGCAFSALASCAQWILAPGGDPSLRPNIVSNSWGGEGGSNVFARYVENWTAAGIFPVFSTGDLGPDCGTASSPGDSASAFAAGATDIDDRIAAFSSRGPSVDNGMVKPNIVAPGVDILSSDSSGSSLPFSLYATMSGTSMAAPHVAGVVALLWAIAPGFLGNVAATQRLLERTAAPLTAEKRCGEPSEGAVPNNTHGYGRLNARLTVDAGTVSSPPPPPPVLTITVPPEDGRQFPCGSPVVFEASLRGSREGQAETGIAWYFARRPSSVTGGSITRIFSCATELGNQVVRATLTGENPDAASDKVVVHITGRLNTYQAIR